MTATLTPAGVDSDTITILEEHWDDELVCIRGDAPATVRLIARCCGQVVLDCPTHHALEREAILLRLNGNGARCKSCFHVWVRPDTYEDFIREVSL